MKSVMISIKPKWCELIASGKKTLEVRRTRPKLDAPFRCYIYCTAESYRGKYLHTSNKSGQLLMWQNPNDCNIMDEPYNYCYSAYTCRGKVIGEFVCDKIDYIPVPYPATIDQFDHGILKQAQMTYMDLYSYAGYGVVFTWHISGLKIYDKPMALSKFVKPRSCENSGPRRRAVTCAPQSWCYVESLQEETE